MSPTLIAFIAIALAFDFLNGFHDSANIVATMISSRAMSPRRAMLLSATAHFIGPFLFGVAVATTIGHEVVQPHASTIPVVMAALLAAITWNLITWLLGIPSSSSHALVGGLVGATIVGHGLDAVQLPGLVKIITALLISPLAGLVGGYALMKLVLFLARGASPRINWFFKRSQTITALALGLSHGANDAQKTMGIITMGLVASGALTQFQVPLWVIAASASAISLGTGVGGWRIIRTLGGKFYKIRPVHSFTAQITSGAVILGAALLGGPVSTTQVVSSAILGIGSAERLSKVRWGVAGSIVTAWLLTIPASGLLAALAYIVVRHLIA
ncbi:MAG: inorganic phosphate transporter [Chloroflexi bacterium]|nr:MAG: anion permease [Anaerolineaceae bacterium 4572_32.2]RLC81770.1 MAG: inorganic phosphate transporter [Chloroflexota bacterium]RLC87495.1 MAG: inorganic phosphate transporter [Chloroflexota bacterium]HEY74453.1 inorganic phosphate transporter [Thermoflexia bacterium]